MPAVPRLATIGVVALLAVAITPAPDAAATSATIDAPADRSVQPSGFTGPVKVTFGDVTTDAVTVRVSGGAYLWEAHPTVTSAGQVSFTIDPVTRAGGYVIQVFAGGESIAGSSFSVNGADAAEITAPPRGHVYLAGSGPTAAGVRWTSIASPGNDYRVDVTGSETGTHSCPYSGAGLEGKTTSCSLPELPADSYTVTARDVTTSAVMATSTFSIVPRIAVTTSPLAPNPFFPYEHDGFRDTTAYSFSLTKAAYVTVVVRNHTGAVSRTLPLGLLAGGSHTIQWLGKNDHGNLVLPGTFTFGITAHANGLTAHGTPRTVTAAVGLHTPPSSAAPVDFYPLVVDGLRDRTTITYSLNRSARVTMEARTTGGNIVRQIDLGVLGAGRHTTTWAGGRDTGTLVSPGTYQVRVFASTLLQQKPGAWLTVRVHAGKP
jgi:flagellar hook assembly protein FlgD